MTLIEMAKIIEAEAGVLDFKGKLAVAQCIANNSYKQEAFAPASKNYSEDSMKCAYLVKEQGIRALTCYNIIQFRSAKYSNPDGSFNWSMDEEHHWLKGLEYLGQTRNGIYTHHLFGKRNTKKGSSPCYEFCGLGNYTYESLQDMNVRLSPTASGEKIDVLAKTKRVEVIEKLDNEWLKIVYPLSNTGIAYVSNVNNRYFKQI